MKKRIRTALFIVLATVTLVLAIVGRPIMHISLTAWNDRSEIPPKKPGFIDDASRLNFTPVLVREVPDNPEKAVQVLRELLKIARSTGKKVAIAGARHSMGGHTIYAHGISLDMSNFKPMALDEKANILHLGSGARWADIIPDLNTHGLSVGIISRIAYRLLRNNLLVPTPKHGSFLP